MRTDEAEAGARKGRSQGIPLSLLRRSRATLYRGRDEAGKPAWVAELLDMPGRRATGASRAEALDRVREMFAERGAGPRAGGPLPF